MNNSQQKLWNNIYNNYQVAEYLLEERITDKKDVYSAVADRIYNAATSLSAYAYGAMRKNLPKIRITGEEVSPETINEIMEKMKSILCEFSRLSQQEEKIYKMLEEYHLNPDLLLRRASVFSEKDLHAALKKRLFGNGEESLTFEEILKDIFCIE